MDCQTHTCCCFVPYLEMRNGVDIRRVIYRTKVLIVLIVLIVLKVVAQIQVWIKWIHRLGR